jgi:SAM-dependent methyltransferase
VYLRISVGSGTGPRTLAWVRTTVSTIFFVDWSMTSWSYAFSRMRIFCPDGPAMPCSSGGRDSHLQCHIGTDTISLARLGARVTGLDFSPSAIAAARDLAARAGVEATFVESELYDACAALGEERFDLVYTGVGALCWLPDIGRWAQVVAALLRPGGRLYIREGHPMMWAFDEHMALSYPYFESGGAIRLECDTTYTEDGAGERLAEPVTFEYNHGLGETVQAVLDAGLDLTGLTELDSCDWKGIDAMVKGDDGRWRLPDRPERMALMYVLQATKGGN